MSRFEKWLRAHVAARIALAATFALLLVGVFVLASRLTAGGQPEATATTPPAAAATAPATPEPPPQPLPVPSVTPDLPADNGAGERVAAGFAVAYATYRYDDTPTALADRVGPYVSPAFAQRLTQAGGGGAVEQDRTTRHEVAAATFVGLQDLGLAEDGRLVVTVTVSQTVTNDQGATSAQYLEEVYLASTPAGWRVDQVDEVKL
jgi:hypothetical protein